MSWDQYDGDDRLGLGPDERPDQQHPSRRISPGKVAMTIGAYGELAASLPELAPPPPGPVRRKASNGASELAGWNHAFQSGRTRSNDTLSEAAGSAGTSLPDELRTSMERSLGTNLDRVRIHTGPESAAAAKSVQATAYTTGQDIHFAPGSYDPGSRAGQHLIAHEVAHTVQQGSGGDVLSAQGKLEISSPGDAHEQEADRFADGFVSGSRAPLSRVASGAVAHTVQRRSDTKHENRAAPTGAGPQASPSGVETPLVKQVRQKALQLDSDSQVFRYDVVVPWYQAIDSLDPGAIDARANLIIQAWDALWQKKLDFDQDVSSAKYAARSARGLEDDGLDEPLMLGRGGFGRMPRQPVHAGRDERAPAISAPIDPTTLPEVKKAKEGVAQARQMVGEVVNLQRYKGRALLGRVRQYDPGVIPTRYVQSEAARAERASAATRKVIDMCQNPGAVWTKSGEPTLSDAQTEQVKKLVTELETDLEYKFMAAAVAEQAQVKLLYEVIDTDSKTRHDVRDKQERAYLTRDGQAQHGIKPERIAEMQHDAGVIADEIHSLTYASDSKINSKLRKYANNVYELEMFFKLLEYRNCVDGMLKRGDTGYIESLLDRTNEYKGRRYNASLDPTMTFGESAGYIAEEAARQGPGAVCNFAAGVFDGMSYIPLVGGVFKQSADSFRDLGGYMDEVTGADDTGRKYRNGVAAIAGNLEAGLMMGGASAELAAGEGLAAGNAGYKIFRAGKTVKELADQVNELTVAYQNAKLLWDNVMSGILAIPELMASAAAGDLDGAIAALDGALDGMLKNAGGMVAQKWTHKGQKEMMSQLQKQSDRNAHIIAKQRVVQATADLAKDPDNAVYKLALASATRDLQAAIETRKGEGPSNPDLIQPTSSLMVKVNVGITDMIKSILITIAVKLLQTLKTRLIMLLKAAAERKRRTSEPDKSLGEKVAAGVVKAVEDAAKAGVEVAKDQLKKLSAKGMWLLVKTALRKHPELFAFEEPIKAALERVAGNGLAMLDVDSMITEPMAELAGDLARDVARHFGYEVPKAKKRR